MHNCKRLFVMGIAGYEKGIKKVDFSFFERVWPGDNAAGAM